MEQEPASMEEHAALLLRPMILSMSPVPRDVSVLLNTTTGLATVLECLYSPEDFDKEDGPLPASKASIDALHVVKASDDESGSNMECPVCLVEFEEVKEMPCKHRFCLGCIDKWLSLHASCSVCRFGMPVQDVDPGLGHDVRMTFYYSETVDPGQGQNNGYELDQAMVMGWEMEQID